MSESDPNTPSVYRLRHVNVSAWQWNGNFPLAELKYPDWLNQAIQQGELRHHPDPPDIGETRLLVETAHGLKPLHLGGWIVRDYYGHLTTYNNDQFMEVFREVVQDAPVPQEPRDPEVIVRAYLFRETPEPPMCTDWTLDNSQPPTHQWAIQDIRMALLAAEGPFLHHYDIKGILANQERGVIRTYAEYMRWVRCQDASDALNEFARWCASEVLTYWSAPGVVVQYLATGNEDFRHQVHSTASDLAREIVNALPKITKYPKNALAMKATAWASKDVPPEMRARGAMQAAAGLEHRLKAQIEQEQKLRGLLGIES